MKRWFTNSVSTKTDGTMIEVRLIEQVDELEKKLEVERDEARIQMCLYRAMLAHWTKKGSKKIIDYAHEYDWEYLVDVFPNMDWQEEQGQ